MWDTSTVNCYKKSSTAAAPGSLPLRAERIPRLPVGGDRLLMTGAGAIDLRAACAAIKQSHSQLRTDGPDPVGQADQIIEAAAVVADGFSSDGGRIADGRARFSSSADCLKNWYTFPARC